MYHKILFFFWFFSNHLQKCESFSRVAFAKQVEYGGCGRGFTAIKD